MVEAVAASRGDAAEASAVEGVEAEVDGAGDTEVWIARQNR